LGTIVWPNAFRVRIRFVAEMLRRRALAAIRYSRSIHASRGRIILQEARPSVSVPLEFFPAVGAEVPKNIEVFWMPPSAGLNRYRYAILNHRALVLDYQDRRVIEILE
jgi:hypothetical protein